MTAYTSRWAYELKERIHLDAMRIEARLLDMVGRISDVSWEGFEGESPQTVLERVREIEHHLCGVVDRRVQQ